MSRRMDSCFRGNDGWVMGMAIAGRDGGMMGKGRVLRLNGFSLSRE